MFEVTLALASSTVETIDNIHYVEMNTKVINARARHKTIPLVYGDDLRKSVTSEPKIKNRVSRRGVIDFSISAQREREWGAYTESDNAPARN